MRKVGNTSNKHRYIKKCIGAILLASTTALSILTFYSMKVEAADDNPVWNFGYIGGVQEWTVPGTGLYRLEVWGASGNGTTYANGGYASGYIELEKDEVLYICAGGRNSFNGGGPAGGGGATHIAIGINRGILRNYSSYRDEVLIVAGGGGSSDGSCNVGWSQCDECGDWGCTTTYWIPGAGGGYTGGSSYGYDDTCQGRTWGVNGGGGGQDRSYVGSSGMTGGGFGQGGNHSGGGWYGGNGGPWQCGSGGSSYTGHPRLATKTVDGVTYSPSTSAGRNGGYGYAKITSLHTHSYTPEVTTAATCTTTGIRTYTCSCDDSYTEVIPALGHAWPSDFSYTASNGISFGLKYKDCERCGIRLDSWWLNQVHVRYQNANGTFTSYSTVINNYYKPGATISWNRAADDEYQNNIGVYYITAQQAKVTYLTVYRNKVTLDINGQEIANQVLPNTNGLCTFDVYINNTKVADDVTDYYNNEILFGSTWEVKDIKPVGGKHYYGVDVK